MSLRRLELLQWFGLLAGAGIWFALFLAGTGASQAVCNPASGSWGIPHDTVQAVILGVGVASLLAAETAAILVFRAVRHAEEQGPPPAARLKFFAIGAMVANLLFLGVIVLSTVATIVNRACQQG